MPAKRYTTHLHGQNGGKITDDFISDISSIKFISLISLSWEDNGLIPNSYTLLYVQNSMMAIEYAII